MTHSFVLRAWRELPAPLQRLAVKVLLPRFNAGVLALVLDEDGRLLMVRHSYDRSGVWRLPGGWMGRGEAPQAAARRELSEELSLDVAVKGVSAATLGAYGQLTIGVVCLAPGSQPLVLSSELLAAEFRHQNELPALEGESGEVLRQSGSLEKWRRV